jgi:hypothetical protein
VRGESDPVAPATTLSDEDLERYARHVIVPGVGARGQARLLRARVTVAGAASAAAICRLALRRCGVRVSDALDASPDCYAAVGIDEIDDAVLQDWAASGKPLVWAALRSGSILRGYDAVFRGDRPLARRPALPVADPTAQAVAAYDTADRVLSVLLDWDQAPVCAELALD